MKKSLVLVSLVFLWFPSITRAGIISETREAKVSITLSGRGNIDIKGSERYISVSSWQKNEIEVFAKVEFKGKGNEKVDEFLANFEEIVQGNIIKAGNSVAINTNLDEPNKVEIGSRLIQFVVIEYGNDELFISYEIKVPTNADLKIKNSYEDLDVMGTYSGKVNIDHYSGDFEGGEFDELDLTLKYGDATIERIGKSEMTLYEQKLEINALNYARIEAKYSELNFLLAERTEFDAYETDIKISSGEKMEGEMKYGNVEVLERLDEIKMYTLYETDFEIKTARVLTIEKSKYGKFTGQSVGTFKISESYEDDIEFESCGSFETDSKYMKVKFDLLEHSLSVGEGYETDVTIGRLGNNAESIFMDGKYNKIELALNDSAIELDLKVKYAELDYPSEKLKREIYIKEDSELAVKLVSGSVHTSPAIITIRGYETDVDIN